MTYTDMILYFQSKTKELGFENDDLVNDFKQLRKKSDVIELMLRPKNPLKSVWQVQCNQKERDYVTNSEQLFMRAKQQFFQEAGAAVKNNQLTDEDYLKLELGVTIVIAETIASL